MRVEQTLDSISDYERAICYYTLPKVISPLTMGLIIAYGVCVLEAILALAYGLWADNRNWTIAGASALAGIVVFGMIAFTVRALLNDMKRRMMLAAARNTPMPSESTDIPDPFAAHILLSHPVNVESEVFACATREGTIEYYVEVLRPGGHWRVTTPQDQPAFDIMALHKTSQWIFSAPLPARLGVYAGNRQIAAITRRPTLRANIVDVFSMETDDERHEIKNGCIYASQRLVGRIYTLRRNVYLDVERRHARSGIIAHFITLK